MPEHTPAPTPHRAIYGFAFFVLCAAICIVYMCWALVPQSVLGGRLGLTYMPDKYFVLFIPPVVMFALTLFGFVVYPAMNLAGTFEATDERTVRDAATIRRCQWLVAVDGGGRSERRRCDRRVTERPADGWSVAQRCERHAESRVVEGETADAVEEKDVRHGHDEDGDVRIEDYCDCAAGCEEWCVLRQRPQHVRELLAMRTVPSVCDLDVAAVSRRLFGGDREIGDIRC